MLNIPLLIFVTLFIILCLIVFLVLDIRESPSCYPVALRNLAFHSLRRYMIHIHKLKINTSVCEEMLRVFNQSCQKFNVKFWLTDGTALGAIREQRIIPDDTDVDVCIFPEYWSNFHTHVVRDLIDHHGFVVIKDHTHYEFTTLSYKNQYIDINCVRPGCLCSSVPGPCDDLIPHIGELKPAQIGSDTYMCPTEPFLEFLYGPTWKTPRTGFKPTHARQPQSSSQ